MWLDRGELDKIIDRSIGETIQGKSPVARQDNRDPRNDYASRDRRDGYDDDDDDRYRGKRRRESF